FSTSIGPPRFPLFPYTTPFRSSQTERTQEDGREPGSDEGRRLRPLAVRGYPLRRGARRGAGRAGSLLGARLPGRHGPPARGRGPPRCARGGGALLGRTDGLVRGPPSTGAVRR